MAFTQSDLDDINAAIASAERQVTIGSQSVTYRSIDDLKKSRELILSDLNTQTPPAVPRPRVYNLYQSGRGYE